jgi:hypothetical protein
MHTNTHYAAARNHSDGTESDQRFSQAEATLALAYEQRTANLIAWLQLQVSVPDLAMDDPAVVELQKRLGL